MPHQHVMNHPVPEISSKDFPELRLFHYKAQGTTGPIGTGIQFLMKRYKVFFEILFENHGVMRVPFVSAALAICLVKILQRE